MGKTLTEEKTEITSLLTDNKKPSERGQMWTPCNPYELEPKNIIEVGLSPSDSNAVYMKIR
jgi:hypothetical protein